MEEALRRRGADLVRRTQLVGDEVRCAAQEDPVGADRLGLARRVHGDRVPGQQEIGALLLDPQTGDLGRVGDVGGTRCRHEKARKKQPQG
jgi:hypothetical protein